MKRIQPTICTEAAFHHQMIATKQISQQQLSEALIDNHYVRYDTRRDGQKWTKEEILILVQATFDYKPPIFVSKLVNRSEEGVRSRMYTLFGTTSWLKLAMIENEQKDMILNYLFYHPATERVSNVIEESFNETVAIAEFLEILNDDCPNDSGT